MVALWIAAAHWGRLWLPLGIAGLTLMFLIWRVAGTGGALRFLLGAPEMDIRGLFRWVLLSYRLAIYVIVTIVIAISSATLWRLGAGISTPPRHDTVTIGQATNFYLRHVADAIPGLKLPQTLGWHLNRTFADPTSRALLLLYKIFVLVPWLAVMAALARRFASTDAFDIHRRPQTNTTADATPETPSAESRV